MAINKKATIVDVAKMAGVSVSTVSVVLNRKNKYVKPELKRKVLDAAKTLNYSPNSIARSLKSQETKTIGLIITNITSPVAPVMVRTIQKIMAAKSIDTMIVSTEEDFEIEKNAIHNLMAKMIDGIIICPVKNDSYQHLINAHEGANVPMVSVERILPMEIGIPCVTTTNKEISYSAIQHLIMHGRKRIALIAMPIFGSNTSDRIEGYSEAMKENGLYSLSLISQTDYMGSNAYSIAVELIQNGKIDAIFAISQSIALGAYKAIIDCGLQIPEDIALIGYDDVDWMEAVPVPITTIRQPIVEMATIAANMILRWKNDPQLQLNNILIPSKLIIRRSCGC